MLSLELKPRRYYPSGNPNLISSTLAPNPRVEMMTLGRILNDYPVHSQWRFLSPPNNNNVVVSLNGCVLAPARVSDILWYEQDETSGWRLLFVCDQFPVNITAVHESSVSRRHSFNWVRVHAEYFFKENIVQYHTDTFYVYGNVG